MHMLHGHLLIVVRTFAFGAYALWILAYFYTSAYCRPYICFWSICFMDTCLFLHKCLLSFIHMLLVHVFHGHSLVGTSAFCRPCTCFSYMCFMGTCFLVQVFFVVHTHAFRTCVSWALAFWYKCFLSSMHMLFIHVFHGHLLFGTSAFRRPCTCFSYTCFMGTCFLVQVLFVACIFHCLFRGLHELIILVFLVV
jgi:hypothetical protein